MNSDLQKIDFHQMSILQKDGQMCYSVTKRRKLQLAARPLRQETIQKVFDFAYAMTFSGDGEHRKHRSGGGHKRKQGEIFADAFQGKIAEFGACNLLSTQGFCTEPDLTVAPRGFWDAGDILVNGTTISIKSAKHFAHLLLLETRDWDAEGNYVPGGGNGEASVSAPAALMLVRVFPNCEKILSGAGKLDAETADREELWGLVSAESWKYDCAGFITKDDLRQIISESQMIPRGALLNGSIPMDADNYYVQAGDLRPAKEICQLL